MSTWHDENRWYVRLMKLAHELAMEGRGEEAQDLRVAATHARNYRWLRDHSSPESCLYYLCSDRTQARFNDPSFVDRHIATDIANNEARVRAKSAQRLNSAAPAGRPLVGGVRQHADDAEEQENDDGPEDRAPTAARDSRRLGVD